MPSARIGLPTLALTGVCAYVTIFASLCVPSAARGAYSREWDVGLGVAKALALQA